MTDRTTLDDGRRIAWAVCEMLDGVIDELEYKDFIRVFLFHKYVSDAWKEHCKEAAPRYQGDQLRIERKMARERFVIPKDASFDDLCRQRHADDTDELIDEAFDAITGLNKAKIDDAFADTMCSEDTKLGDTGNRCRPVRTGSCALGAARYAVVRNPGGVACMQSSFFTIISAGKVARPRSRARGYRTRDRVGRSVFHND